MNDKDNLETAVDTSISKEMNIKMKKNLLWLFIFAVIMIFAGLTSGYIVSQGGNFWVNIKMPSAFTISTFAIIASSGFLIVAKWAVKQDKTGLTNGSLAAAFALGIVFGIYQFIGWGQLTENGSRVNAGILNTRGKYGKYFTLIYQGKEITYDNAIFYLKGEPVSEDLMTDIKTFAGQLVEGSKSDGRNYILSNYGIDFTLRFNNNILTYTNNRLMSNGVNLSEVQHNRLHHFAESIVVDRGDFIMKGKYGDDFIIYYGGEALEFKNRTFYLKGVPLSAKKLDDLNSQDNTASSYIYAFTVVHLLHWIGGIISLLVMFIKGLQVRYSSEDYLGITLGSTYWHFLGILWLYLYAFLIFIH